MYVKEMPFTGSKVDPMKNLKITLLSSTNENENRDWYYGHPEARNMGGNMISEDVPLSQYLKEVFILLKVLLLLMILIVSCF